MTFQRIESPHFLLMQSNHLEKSRSNVETSKVIMIKDKIDPQRDPSDGQYDRPNFEDALHSRRNCPLLGSTWTNQYPRRFTIVDCLNVDLELLQK